MGACAVQTQIASRRRPSIRPAEHFVWGSMRSPKRPLPRHAMLLKSRYRGLEMQTARVQKSNLGYGARDINARTRVLR